MREITTTTKVYKFDELDEAGKRRALSDMQAGEYIGGEDNEATLHAFEAIFPVKAIWWEYGCGRASITPKIDVSDEVDALRGPRLAAYIQNNYGHALFKPEYLAYYKGKARYSRISKSTSCVLTGFFMDDEILDPIYSFLKLQDKYQSFSDILNDCLWN